MSYITPDFLLNTPEAKKLYMDFAKDMPIFDYHCHLSEKQLLEDKQFESIYEVWLGGDHYKWRLMRNYGIDERYITGDATPYEKFVKYIEALETAFGNPLYHWSQVELAEYFNCELDITLDNADTIWEWCNEYIKVTNMTPSSLIEKSNVRHIFTTNEATDDLETFALIKEKFDKFSVTPAFRADKILGIHLPSFLSTIDTLSSLTHPISDISSLESAVESRLKLFVEIGTVATDISLERVLPVTSREDADTVLQKILGGGTLTTSEIEVYQGYITYYLLRLYHSYDLATELHLGAMRNNNTKQFKYIGADTGYDSISAMESTSLLSRLMDRLESEDSLPRMILFNLNPKMTMELVALAGCFQDGKSRGKIQYGPAWWFLDNRQGMTSHLEQLTSIGHIGAFVGMLTDSRSFLSYPRHHYFRRILCDYLGGMMNRGEITNDMALVGRVVRDVSYLNSIRYFSMPE